VRDSKYAAQNWRAIQPSFPIKFLSSRERLAPNMSSSHEGVSRLPGAPRVVTKHWSQVLFIRRPSAPSAVRLSPSRQGQLLARRVESRVAASGEVHGPRHPDGGAPQVHCRPLDELVEERCVPSRSFLPCLSRRRRLPFVPFAVPFAILPPQLLLLCDLRVRATFIAAS
jgi:hypothetical protein